MKKSALFCLLIGCLFVIGCSNQNGGPNYNGKLTIAGVGPEISFEPTVEEGTLVLKGYFEDHSDHIFLPAGTREDKFDDESEYLPGNTVKFVGYVAPLDTAAGNHYYEVVNVDKLIVVNYSNEKEVKELLDSYNYCENDLDCGYFIGECPLGCYIPLNIKYIDIASNIVSNFINHLDEQCVYDCLALNKAKCENYKCEMYDADASEDVHGCGGLYKDPDFEGCDDTIYDLVCANDGNTYKNDCFACIEPLVETYTFGQCENNSGITYCTARDKSAENCNMIYDPVCGSDSRTYGNSCVACQSETVETYTQGECESSAFVVEGDSDYLQEAMDILNNEGIVSCDMFYSDFGKEEVHSMFVADKDRFYSAIDDYSDPIKRNVFYRLAKDGKVYDWSTFPDSETIITDHPADIESEIASIVFDLGKKSDFKIDCHNGIDDEHLFDIVTEK